MLILTKPQFIFFISNLIWVISERACYYYLPYGFFTLDLELKNMLHYSQLKTKNERNYKKSGLFTTEITKIYKIS